MLNWTHESVITLVSGIPILIGIVTLLVRYQKHKNRLLLLLSLSWGLHAVYLTNFGIAYLFLHRSLLVYNSIILVTNLFLFTVIFDHMSSGRLEPIKFGLVSIVGLLLIYSAFLPGAVITDQWSNGSKTFVIAGPYRILTAAAAFYLGLLYLYLSLRIINRVPFMMKKWAYLNFVGVFIFSQVVTIFFVFDLTSIIPGIASLLSAMGAMLSIIAFYKSPQMIYVLPFDTYKLLVIDRLSSATIYAFEWYDDLPSKINDNLLSSALSGLNAFSIEALQRGNIREIHLDMGAMMVHTYHNLQFVILASRISPILEENLTNFANFFVDEYAIQLKGGVSPVYEISGFDQSDHLIMRYFPYIPIRANI